MICLPAGQPEAEHKASVADFISTLAFQSEWFSTNNPLSYIPLSYFNSTQMFLFSSFYSMGHQTPGKPVHRFLSEVGCIPHSTCAFIYPFKYILPNLFNGSEMSSFLNFSLYLRNVNTALNVRTVAWHCQTDKHGHQ